MMGGFRVVRRCGSEKARDEIIEILQGEGIRWRCSASCVCLSLPHFPEPRIVYRISVPSADYDRADHAIHRAGLALRSKQLGADNNQK